MPILRSIGVESKYLKGIQGIKVPQRGSPKQSENDEEKNGRKEERGKHSVATLFVFSG